MGVHPTITRRPIGRRFGMLSGFDSREQPSPGAVQLSLAPLLSNEAGWLMMA